MSTITVNIPSEFLALDFWKAHWYYIYIPIHVLWGMMHHIVALPSIKRWNALSDEERKALSDEELKRSKRAWNNSKIPTSALVPMFLMSTFFHAAFRIIYSCVRIIMTPLCSIASGSFMLFPSWNKMFEVPNGFLPYRFSAFV